MIINVRHNIITTFALLVIFTSIWLLTPSSASAFTGGVPDSANFCPTMPAYSPPKVKHYGPFYSCWYGQTLENFLGSATVNYWAGQTIPPTAHKQKLGKYLIFVDTSRPRRIDYLNDHARVVCLFSFDCDKYESGLLAANKL